MEVFGWPVVLLLLLLLRPREGSLWWRERDLDWDLLRLVSGGKNHDQTLSAKEGSVPPTTRLALSFPLSTTPSTPVLRFPKIELITRVTVVWIQSTTVATEYCTSPQKLSG